MESSNEVEEAGRVSCLEVRERLTEYALGLLAAAEMEQIEQHLEWCPGCRKEAAELAEGAASFGLAIPAVQPPAALESKVLGRLRAATSRSGHNGFRRARALVGATLVAALVAFGAVGWALAERNHALTLEERLTGMRARVESFAQVLSSGGGKTFQAALLPPEGRQGSGFAVVFNAPHQDDLLFVDVVLPENVKGPFVVQVIHSNRVWEAGTVKKTASGEWVLAQRTGVDLRHPVSVTVLDQQSHIVLTGTVHPYAGS
jgi:putative zinc finger protein